ncbi:MAG: HNH endonuclease signature motif containing protein, partial [Ilumatobacter sp.]
RDRLSFGAVDDSRWRISGNFDLATGRRIEEALTQQKDALFERGDTDVTWADALVEMSKASLDAVPSAARRDRYRTWLHFNVPNGATTTTDGWRIPMAIRDHLLCDGVVQPVWERDGLPFSVGRSHRIVPDRTRRIIERRDRGCRVPGCTARSFVEIHHIIHWLHGGTSDTWNLLSLCAKHHRQHHRGELGIAGNADDEHGIAFTDIRGRTFGGRGHPGLPDTDPDPPEPGFRPPSGERMNYRYFTGWVSDRELARRRSAARSRRPSR